MYDFKRKLRTLNFYSANESSGVHNSGLILKFIFQINSFFNEIFKFLSRFPLYRPVIEIFKLESKTINIIIQHASASISIPGQKLTSLIHLAYLSTFFNTRLSNKSYNQTDFSHNKSIIDAYLNLPDSEFSPIFHKVCLQLLQESSGTVEIINYNNNDLVLDSDIESSDSDSEIESTLSPKFKASAVSPASNSSNISEFKKFQWHPVYSCYSEIMYLPMYSFFL